MTFLKLLYTAFLCCCFTLSIAQISSIDFNNIQFNHLDKNSGLPNDRVWKVFQDSKGFIWMGTHNGLTRWDGLNFRHFQPNPADTTAIMGTTIMDITEGKDGKLWFLVHNKGLSRFDPNTETFKNFRHQPHLKGLMRMKNFDDGYLWLGAYGNGMFRYEIATDKLTLLPLKAHFDDAEDLFRLNSIIDMVQDMSNNNILWCAANNGLFRFDKTTLEFEYFQSPAKGTALMTINGLFMDEPNTLWMGAWGGGLISLHIPSKKWTYHTYDKPNMLNYDGKGYSDIVKSMLRKSPTELWVQTRDNGAGVFDIISGKFQFFTPDNNNPVAIKAGTGNRLFKDREERIWFTFEDAGVSYINPECQAFFNIPLDLSSCGDKFSENNITDFGYDITSDKIYAVANGCSGLFEINPKDWSYQAIPTLGFEDAYQIYMNVLVTQNGTVWVGGESNKGGKAKEVKRPSLLYLDKQIGKLVPFNNQEISTLNLQERNIVDIQAGKNNVIWVATNDGALIEINRTNENIQAYALTDSSKPQIKQIISKEDNIWVATDKGVYQFDLKTKQFTLLDATADYVINSFAQDNNSILWLGTMQNGLKKLVDGKMITPDASNLPYTLIDKIIVDENNDLWLSTQEGISFLDKSVKTYSDGHFQVFDKADGLVFNSFYLHGFTRLPDGTLLLGQNDQFYHILPECLTHPKTVEPVYLSSFQLFDKDIPISIQDVQEIELGHDENYFTIHFSSLTFCQADKVRFSYTMEGLDKDWFTTEPGQTYRNYTNMSAGTYTFRIKRTGFSDAERTFKIIIHPPIWLSMGAYLLYFLLGLVTLISIYRFQLNQQRERQAAKNLKEIDAVKNRTYTNISHEFRTPLTLIMGVSEQLQNMNLGDLANQKIEGIKYNGNRILYLINQILDLRKLEADKYELKLVQKEVIGLLKYIGYNFEPLVQDKGIQLKQTIEFDSLVIDHDPDNLISVITNLLDNAVKFTPKGGIVHYAVKQTNQQLLIEVTDTGKGITTADLSKIFDRYVSTNAPNYTSTGIGLSLTKALVDLMRGTIEVKSTLGKGTCFKVTLPVTNNAPKGFLSEEKILSNIPINKPTCLPNTTIDIESDKPIILIVEDKAEIAQLIAAMFDDNYQVAFATNGKEGLEKALEFIPDLVISDVMMPIMDGFELCQTLKSDTLTSHIPIILLTAKAEHTAKIAGLTKGADAYLTKPFDTKELLIWVTNLINSRKALKEVFGNPENLVTPSNSKKKELIAGIDLDMEDTFVQNLLYFFDKNIANPDYSSGVIHLDLKISKTQAYKKIKALTHLSPGNFLRFYRLIRAKHLLSTTDMNITEVAFETGFQDSSYFSRAFKETFQVTPSKYKETRVRTEE